MVSHWKNVPIDGKHLHGQVLQGQLKQECIRRRQLKRDFEELGSEDLGRLVGSFLDVWETCEMFPRACGTVTKR